LAKVRGGAVERLLADRAAPVLLLTGVAILKPISEISVIGN
jgi:hypothetical protein